MKSFSQGESLEKELIQSINGYSGYQATENRGKSDKRLREFLAAKIQEIEHSFEKSSDRIANKGRNDIAGTVNKLIRQLKVLINSLSRPSYQNSPFFLRSSLNSEVLSQAYEYDSQIKNHLYILTDEASDLERVEEISQSGEFLNHLFDVIDSLNQIIIEREFLLAGGVEDVV